LWIEGLIRSDAVDLPFYAVASFTEENATKCALISLDVREGTQASAATVPSAAVVVVLSPFTATMPCDVHQAVAVVFMPAGHAWMKKFGWRLA